MVPAIVFCESTNAVTLNHKYEYVRCVCMDFKWLSVPQLQDILLVHICLELGALLLLESLSSTVGHLRCSQHGLITVTSLCFCFLLVME